MANDGAGLVQALARLFENAKLHAMSVAKISSDFLDDAWNRVKRMMAVEVY